MQHQQVENLGYVAGILTTFAFVPQVLQVYRTKSTRDVSLGMFALFTFGVLLWLIYGVWTEAPPVIAANAVTLLLAASVLVAKLRWK